MPEGSAQALGDALPEPSRQPVLMSRKRRDLARTLATTSITFAVILVLEMCGWISAGNDILHGLYFRWSPDRQSAHRVIALSVDTTPEAQAEHSWTPSKLRAALHALMQGNPAVVALVDAEETFSLRPEQVDAIIQDPAYHQRVVAASSETFSLGGATGITAIQPATKTHNVQRDNALEAVSQHIAQSRLKTGPFPINYLKSREALPRIPFWTLLANQSQTSSFRGNVVLIGPTRGPKARVKNTPVGPMSSMEIHAHAISGLIDSVAWRRPNPLHVRTLLFLLLFAWSYRLSKQTRPGILREGAILSLACLGVDWIFFTNGIMIWGPSASLTGIWLAQFIAIRSALLTVTNKVGYLQTRLAEMLPAAVAEKKEAKKDLVDDAFWQDLVDFGRGYLQLDFEGMIAELPEKEWHIQFRASTGSATTEIAEQRRDIRRAPFRSPFLTQRCGWAKNFVRNREFPKSLVVPLHHQSKLYGYWLLHMHQHQELGDDFLRTCESLGKQMASVIAEQRGQQESQDELQIDRAQLAVLEVERDVQRLEKERSWAMQVIEQDPNPIMMASLWGPIELMNEQMRERTQLLFPAGIPDNDIRAVIAKLCGGNQAQVQTLMRSTVVDQDQVEVPRAPDEQETFVQGDYNYFLRSIEVGQTQNQAQSVPDINHVRVLLVAENRYEAPHAVDLMERFEEQSVPVPTDEPSANDCEPKTCKIAPPKPFSDQDDHHQDGHHQDDHHQDDHHQNSGFHESIYYEDGWEDWTPDIHLDPRDDIALPSNKRMAS